MADFPEFGRVGALQPKARRGAWNALSWQPLHRAIRARRPMSEIDQHTIAHLQIVQVVISRMAANGFALKALAVALAS